MDAHYNKFDEEEENKICYMEVFEEYKTLVETCLLNEIQRRCGNVDLDELTHQFINLNHSIKTENPSLLQDEGEVIELILSLTDFLVFKGLILDHKFSRSGRYDHINFLQINPCIQESKNYN